MQYVPVTVLVPQEITIPAEPCSGGCGAYVVRAGRWKSIKREVRRQLRGKFKLEKSRGACTTCYEGARATGDQIDLPTRQVTDEIFAEEYNTMRAANMSDYVIRDALGMSQDAFEKALERGRKAGRVTDEEMKTTEWRLPRAHYSGGHGNKGARMTSGSKRGTL